MKTYNEIDIKYYDNDGNIQVRCSAPVTQDAFVHYELMQSHYCKLSFKLSKPIYFLLGDFIDTPYGRFELIDLTKAKDNDTIGYSYEILFDAYYRKFKNKILKYRPNTGSQEATFSLTSTISTHVEVIMKSLAYYAKLDKSYLYDPKFEGEGTDYTYVIDASVDANAAKLITYSNTSMLDAIANIAQTFGCEWWFEGNILHFGTCENTNAITDFRLNDNIVSMSSSQSQSTYANRVYAFGAARNLPSGYKNDADADITKDGVVEKRLMLPNSAECSDKNKQLLAENGFELKNGYIQVSGLREDQYVEGVTTNDDIYPRNLIKTSKVTSYEKDVEDESTPEEGDFIKRTFYRVNSLSIINEDGEKTGDMAFRKSYILSGKNLHIVFQSGSLNGMDFECEFNPDGVEEILKDDDGNPILKDGKEQINPKSQVFEIVANEDYGRFLPDTTLHPKEGDTFVLYNWDSTKLGDTLVSAASNELLTDAIKDLKKSMIDPTTYTCTAEANYSYNQGRGNLHGVGDRVNLYNKGYGDSYRASRIIGYEFCLDIPYDGAKYYVGEKPSYSRLNAMESKIEELVYNGQSYLNGNGGGGKSIYIIKSYDKTAPTDYNVYSAKAVDEQRLNKLKDDTAKGTITWEKVQKLLSGLLIGNSNNENGGSWTPDAEGRSHLITDYLEVRMKAIFEELVIKKTSTIGGKEIISPTGGVVAHKVEEVTVTYNDVSQKAYRCYFLAEQDGDKIDNDFVVEDQVRSESFNLNAGKYHKTGNHFFWRLAIGRDEEPVELEGKKYHYIDLSDTDCATASDVPAKGDVLNQCGNRTDVERQNCLIFSSVDTYSPSISLYHGINSYSFANREYVEYGVNKQTNKAFFNVYGDMYVGDRPTKENGYEGSSYIRYDSSTKQMSVKAKISAKSTVDGKELSQYFKKIGELQNQVDGAIETWFYDGVPTLENAPAISWKTDKDKEIHLGDLYYNNKTGKAYRFAKDSNTYKWTLITDTDIAKALSDARMAQETANGKMKVFSVQPTTPYQVGDIWVNATYPSDGSTYKNEVLRCQTNKAAGSQFAIGDWIKASKYTDDTVANAAKKAAEDAQKAAQTAQTDIKNLGNTVTDNKKEFDNYVTDGYLEPSEIAAMAQDSKRLEDDFAAAQKSYNEVKNAEVLANTKELTDLNTAFATLTSAKTELVTYLSDISKRYNETDTNGKAAIVSAVGTKFTNFQSAYSAFYDKLGLANAYITSKIYGDLQQNITDLAGYKYLKDALGQTTDIDGGLVMTTLLALRDGDGNVQSGINGAIDPNRGKKSIATWWGGQMVDKDYNSGNLTPATSLIRFDGSGYLANGAIWWDVSGKVHADPTSFIISENNLGAYLIFFEPTWKAGSAGTSVADLVSLKPNAPFSKLGVSGDATFEGAISFHGIKLTYDSTNKAIKIDGNLYATGGITAYGAGASTTGGGGGLNGSVKSYSSALKLTSESLSEIASAYSIKALDSRISSLEGGSATAISVSGSGNAVTSVTKNGTTISVVKGSTFSLSGHTHKWADITDRPSSLKNPSALSWSGYSSGSYDGSAAKSISIPNNTNQLTNGAGFITASASITGNAATATKVNHSLSVFGKSFNGSADVTVADTDLIASISTATANLTDKTEILTSYASDNGFNDSNAKNRIYRRPASVIWGYINSKTISNADKLDNVHLNGIFTALSNTNNGVSMTIGTVAKSLANMQVYSATKLVTARNIALNGDLMGNANFDGSANITINGYMSYCNATVSNTNTYPWRRIAKVNELTGNYLDGCILLYISEGFNGGYYGIARVYIRTDNLSTDANASCSIQWISRNGYGLDSLKIAMYKTTGKAYYDVFLKMRGVYASVVIRTLQDQRGGFGKRFTLVNSTEGTNAASHTEAYATIEDAATAIHNQAYTSIAQGSDVATVHNADMVDGIHASGLFTNLSNSGNSLSITVGGTNKKLTVNYASNAGNADTLDGVHASGLFTNLSNSGNNISITIGGTNKTLTAAYATNCDTVDGYHAQLGSSNPYGKIPVIGTDGVIELGHYIDFHHDNTTDIDYSVRLQTNGNHGNVVTLPTATGTLALTSDNVASATKLQTARTIWGQSFNGTANVSGNMTGVGNINTSAAPAGTIYTNNWFRSKGSTGWFSEDHGGGWYMSDNTWIRNFGGKDVYLSNKLSVNGNVGIGTTAPSHKLHVSGEIYTTTKVNINGIILEKDSNGDLKVNGNLYATGGISAYGTSSAGSGGGLSGSVKSYADALKLASESLSEIASAYSIKKLSTRITSLEGGSATSISVSGGGNAVTSVTKNGTTISVVKGSTFLTSHQSLSAYLKTENANNTFLKLSGGTISNDLIVNGSIKTTKLYLPSIGDGYIVSGVKDTNGSDFASVNCILKNWNSLGISSYDDIIRIVFNSRAGDIYLRGKLSAASLSGNLSWSYITDRPSSYTPSAHTHKWTEITDRITKVSQLTNDKGYLTSHQSLAAYLKSADAANTYSKLGHTHSYAGSASAGGDATRALKLKDYNGALDIYCGFSGAGLLSGEIGYMTGIKFVDNIVYYKDVSKGELQKWLNLGARAYDNTSYLPITGGTLTGQLNIVASALNGAYNGLRIGDDCYIGDCNFGNTIGLMGVGNNNAGMVKFGKGGMQFGYNGSNHIASTTAQWTNLNADLLDGWHKDNIVWSGAVNSNTANLSHYWAKLFDITVTDNRYDDRSFTFLFSNGFNDTYSVVVLRIRQNGANGSGAYDFDIYLRELVGNMSSRLRVYYNNATGNVQLWGNCQGQYGSLSYTIIKKTGRTSADFTSQGTLVTNTSFSAAQSLPATTGDSHYTLLDGATRIGIVKQADQLVTARSLWGQSFNGTANISGSMTGVGDMTFDAGARIKHGSGNLYIGNSDNSNWIGVQDICSQSSIGDGNWSLRTSGAAHFKDTTINGTATINDLLSLVDGSHKGLKMGSTYISSLDGEVILQGNTALRFGNDAWDYNQWAGLKYDHSIKTVYLGIADGSIFKANSAQSGGVINLKQGISSVYTPTLYAGGDIYHTGAYRMLWKNSKASKYLNVMNISQDDNGILTIGYGNFSNNKNVILEGYNLNFRVGNDSGMKSMWLNYNNGNPVLSLDGNFYATGGVTAYKSSDERLKHDIHGVDSLAIIKAMGGTVAFRYNADNKDSIGWIAQRVLHNTFMQDLVEKDDKGFLKINYWSPKLIAVAFGAIEQVDDEVSRLKARVVFLESEVQRLSGKQDGNNKKRLDNKNINLLN